MTPSSSKELLDYLLEGNPLSPDQLNQFLQENPVENQYLDYKHGTITTRQKRDEGRRTIREYISGFANSDGGVLIIGVDENSPRQITPCEHPPGGQALDQWASRCLHDMVAYFSPQPRFQVIEHPQGHVLVMAVARAPSLVPCVEARELKYFFRIGDSTLAAPEYLIADLVLGRRQHPLLDLHCNNNISEEKSIFNLTAGRADNANVREVYFNFTIENMSLVAAYDIEIGMVGWSFSKQEGSLNRYLLSYVDIVTSNNHSHLRSFQPTHDSIKGLFLGAFQQAGVRFPNPHPYRFPLVRNGKAHCALYILSKGAPPVWFQLEYSYGSGRAGRVALTRKGTGRPIVSWEEV